MFTKHFNAVTFKLQLFNFNHKRSLRNCLISSVIRTYIIGAGGSVHQQAHWDQRKGHRTCHPIEESK